MAEVSDRFVWPRGQLLEIEEIPPSPLSATLAGGAGGDRDWRITQIGPETVTAFPMKDRASLYLTFGSLEKTPEACLEFARRWGFLGAEAKADSFESVTTDWYPAIDNMRQWIEALKAAPVPIQPPGFTFGKSEIRIEPGDTPSGCTIVVVPGNLISALRAQMIQAVNDGAKLLTCDQCGDWFEAGAGHRRLVARFCSTTCRDRHHNLKRREKRHAIGG